MTKNHPVKGGGNLLTYTWARVEYPTYMLAAPVNIIILHTHTIKEYRYDTHIEQNNHNMHQQH